VCVCVFVIVYVSRVCLDMSREKCNRFGLNRFWIGHYAICHSIAYFRVLFTHCASLAADPNCWEWVSSGSLPKIWSWTRLTDKQVKTIQSSELNSEILASRIFAVNGHLKKMLNNKFITQDFTIIHNLILLN